MRTYKYEALSRLTYDEIVEITDVPESFKVIGEGAVGRRICDFIENEAIFANSDKSLKSRLRYFAGGLVGMFVPNFVSLWNRAVMSGFKVDRIEYSGVSCEIVFCTKRTEQTGTDHG